MVLHKKLHFLSFALVFLAGLTLLSGRASANPASAYMPSNTYGIVSTANGPGSYYSPSSISYMYVPTTQPTASLRLVTEIGTLSWMSIGIPAGCTMPVEGMGGAIANPGVGSQVNISNTANAHPSRQITNGGTTYNIYCVSVSTSNTGNNYFRLYTPTPGALIGVYPGPIDSLGTGFASTTSTSGYIPGGEWSQHITFSPPCGVTSGAADVFLYDLDMYTTTNGIEMNPHMRVRMLRTPKPGIAGSPTYLALTGNITTNPASGTYKPNTNASLGDNNFDNVVDGTAGTRPAWRVYIANGVRYNSNYTYRLEVNGIRNTNLIRINLPYDQINSSINCAAPDRPPTISATADCANRRILITTADPDHSGASTYAIQRQYRIYNTTTATWGAWSAWAGITHTAGVNNSQRRYAISAGNDFGLHQFRFRTVGVAPTGAPAPPYVYSAYMYYGPCVRATCAVVSAPTVLYINQANSITVRVTNNGANNGRPWATNEGYQLRRTAPAPVSIAAYLNSGAAVPVGGTRNFTFTVTPTAVGSGVGAFTWQMSRGATLFGSACSLTRSVVYRPPVASCTITPPPVVEAGTNGTITVTARFTGPSNAAPSGQVTASSLSGNGAAPRGPSSPGLPANIARGGAVNLTFDNFPFGNPGTATWNASVTVSTVTGHGSAYNVSASCTRTSAVGQYPYLKEFGGDVWTGGNFINIDPSSCTPPTGSAGSIFAHNTNADPENSGRYVGASAQLTVTALLTINQFSSAGNRDTAAGSGNTFSPRGLTFANNNAANTYGGGYGANSARCITNYFDDTKVEPGNPDIPVLTSGFPPTSGTAVVPGSNVASTASVTASSYHQTNPSVSYLPSNAVDGISGVHDSNEWATQGQTSGNDVWLELNFPNDITIDEVRLFDRPNPSDHITSGRLEFSGGASGASTVNFGALNNNGAVVPVTFSERTVRRIRMVVTAASAGTFNTGLSEIQVWTTDQTIPVSNGFPAGRSQYHFDTSQSFGDGTPIQIPNGTQTAVFVSGDVYINSNITFATGASSIGQMPNFALVVCGNIYVDGSVTRLDGLYIAQPGTVGADGRCTRTAASTNGTLYTCATAVNTACNHTNVYSAGNRQLSINGGVIANRIKWLRILNNASLHDATFGEVPAFDTGAGTRASEVVNFTPQMYLAPSGLADPGDVPGGGADSGTSEPYDSIRSLPPIF